MKEAIQSIVCRCRKLTCCFPALCIQDYTDMWQQSRSCMVEMKVATQHLGHSEDYRRLQLQYKH